MTQEELDKDMIESIEMWLRENELQYVEKELTWLNELRSRLIDPMNQEGLEDEIDACWQNWLSPSNQKEVEGVLPKTEFAMYARHFAKWGAEHAKK